jgi:hypothetical protein
MSGLIENIPADPQSPLDWGRKALSHAAILTQASSGRGSATAAEAKAAQYVQQQLADLGIQDVHLQAFQGLRSIWLFLSLAFGMALVGHAAFWLLRRPLGAPAALAVSWAAFTACAALLWRKFTFRSFPLSDGLPHGPSQNVVARIDPTGSPAGEVVLVGHLDSHRAVWWFAHDWLAQAYAILTPVALWGVLLAPILYLLASLTALQIFAWLGLGFGSLHFLAWFTGMTADLGGYSPGANDNASAVGTLLALAERLQSRPLGGIRVWLAFTGCEESGCDGMLQFLQEYSHPLRNALFLDFELVGIGERLVYIQREGLARGRHISSRVEQLLQAAGASFDLQPIDAAHSGAFTEMGTVWEYGFEGACLMALRSHSGLLPEWHRLTDTAERLQPETLQRVQALAWEILQTFDRKPFQ